jgi:alpha-glucosidase
MNEPANFCGFPCDDPDRRARGLPPRPPPLREPPRQIPGFPSGHHTAIHDHTSKRAVGSDQERLGNPNLQHSMDEIVHVNIDHEGDDLLRPPYRIANHVSSGDLSDHTVYTDLQHANGQWTYDTHNLYGMRMRPPYFLCSFFGNSLFTEAWRTILTIHESSYGNGNTRRNAKSST